MIVRLLNIFLIFILFIIKIEAAGIQKNYNKVTSIDLVLIEKEKRIMSLFLKGKLIKTYKVALGFAPVGHKQQEGDGKTPEGVYTISYKNPNGQFHKALKISYPNKQDQKNAQKRGVSPGDFIMIHGLGKAFGWLGKSHILKDWTLGCIAVTNAEIDEVYKLTPIGTKVEIRP